jgi:serralysin
LTVSAAPEADLDPYPLAAITTPTGGPEAYLDAGARATATTDTGKPSDTIDQAAHQLVRNEPGWSGAFGEPFTVTYAYRASAPAQMPSDTGGFERFNAAQIAQTELALRAWSDVANIKFVRVGSGTSGDGAYSNDATILMGDYTTGESGAAAFTYFPGSTASTASAGDMWVNATQAYNTSPTMGNYGGSVLVHELGHAIGLQHPSDYDAASGASFTYAADASYYEDDRQYTVMSYFSESDTGADYGGLFPAAPQLDDIAADQLLYGPNMATRTGDTVYGFHANADEPWFIASSSSSKLIFAVWDAGGRDTFDFSGYGQNQLIDLRAGNFSNVGGLIGNVAIAQNVTIENAVGGSGADVIHGNGADNSLLGGAGADTLDGGFAGNDTMFGGDGGDSIAGGPGFDQINGNGGADTIDGGAGGNDWLLGGQGDDLITAHSGSPIENGNIGADTIIGGDGANFLRGGQGADSLVGGPGADQISGDMGGDTMTGGPGADIFQFSPGAGHDRITDFNPGEGDRIELHGVATYSLSQNGADAVVSYGSGDTIVLAGVDSAKIPSGSILLA